MGEAYEIKNQLCRKLALLDNNFAAEIEKRWLVIIWSSKMNKQFLFVFIVLQSALLANCKGCHEASTQTNTEENISEWPQKIEADTIIEAKQEIEDKIESEEKLKASSTAKPSSGSVRSSSKKYHDDNMRGWDPASEDDMDDNGMSRYMENNDEEGWD